MIRKQYADLHEEALERLCFVCGELVPPDRCVYDVNENIDLLCKGLKCATIFSMPGITPSHFCAKCFSAMNHVANGTTVQTKRTLIDWEECRSGCSTCARLTKRRQSPGRKKKVSVSVYFPYPAQLMYSLSL